MNEKRISQIKLVTLTDKKKKVVDFVTAERTNAGMKMFLCMSRHAYLKALSP